MNCELKIISVVQGKKSEQKGKLWIKDNKSKYEYLADNISMVVYSDFNKNEMVTYIKESNIAMKTKIPDKLDDVNDQFRVVNTIKDKEIEKFEKKGKEKIDKVDCYVYEGLVKGILFDGLSGEASDAKIKLYVQADNNLVKRCEIYKGDELKEDIVVKSYNLNTVRDVMVDIDIPENVKITENM